MLTLAPPSDSPSLTAWIGALAAPLGGWFTPSAAPSAPGTAPTAEPAAESPVPCQAVRAVAPASAHGSYWPCERLNTFILQMAAHGHCVNTAMMLGHRPYAEQQLAKALAVRDDALRALAAELHAFFEAPPESAALRADSRPGEGEKALTVGSAS